MPARRLTAVGLGLIVLAAVGTASTAGNTLPSSVAVYQSTTVTGATLVSMKYDGAAGAITTVYPRLRATDLALRTVTARFGAGPTVTCVAGETLTDVVTNLGEGTFTCTGFTERADRPGPLTVTVEPLPLL